MGYLSCTNSPTLSPTEPTSARRKSSEDFPFGVPIAIVLMTALISHFVYKYRHRNDQKMMNDEIRRKHSDHVRNSSISKEEDQGIMKIPVLLNELNSLKPKNKNDNDGVAVIDGDEEDGTMPSSTNQNDNEDEEENVPQENDDDVDKESEEVMLIASNTNNDDNVEETNNNEVCDVNDDTSNDNDIVTDSYSNEDNNESTLSANSDDPLNTSSK